MPANLILLLLFCALLAPALAAEPTTRESADVNSTQRDDLATKMAERAHRRSVILKQKQLVADLNEANKKALETADIAEIEHVDAALTKAKKDLKQLLLREKEIESAEAAVPSTKASTDEPQTIIFVCDATGSMVNNLASVKAELLRAVRDLKPDQFFDIIFFHDELVLKLDDDVLEVTAENQQKAQNWIGHIDTVGTTDPVPALTFALKLKPDLIYFMSDAADFPDAMALQNTFRDLNSDHKTKVNTILFFENRDEQEANKESEPLMRGIALGNGGVFKCVRADQLKSDAIQKP